MARIEDYAYIIAQLHQIASIVKNKDRGSSIAETAVVRHMKNVVLQAILSP